MVLHKFTEWKDNMVGRAGCMRLCVFAVACAGLASEMCWQFNTGCVLLAFAHRLSIAWSERLSMAGHSKTAIICHVHDSLAPDSLCAHTTLFGIFLAECLRYHSAFLDVKFRTSSPSGSFQRFVTAQQSPGLLLMVVSSDKAAESSQARSSI